MRVCRRGHTLWDDCVVFFCLPVRLPFTYTYAKNRERVRRQWGLKTFFSSRFKSWTFLLLNASFFLFFLEYFLWKWEELCNFSHEILLPLCIVFWIFGFFSTYYTNLILELFQARDCSGRGCMSRQVFVRVLRHRVGRGMIDRFIILWNQYKLLNTQFKYGTGNSDFPINFIISSLFPSESLT